MSSIGPDMTERAGFREQRAGECRFCGLPIRFGASALASPERYCCFGCELAEALCDESRGDDGASNWRARIGFAIFFSMNVVALSMVLWTQDLAATESTSGFAPLLWSLLRYLCLLLTLPVLVLLGRPLFAGAWRRLAEGRFGMDALLSAGVVAALAYSCHAVFVESGHVYFEVICVVLVVTTLGRWLEAQGKARTVRALSELEKLIPERALILDGAQRREIAVGEIAAGQFVWTPAGGCVPCDGLLVSDQAELDERLVTGECESAFKSSGDFVAAGTFSLGKPAVVKAVGAVGAGTMARLIDAVRHAGEAKSRLECLADRAAAIFVPLVAAVALAAFVWHAGTSGVRDGLLASLAVALVACPCALGLATPLAHWAARAAAARRGILFRGSALESLGRVQAVYFDKTGTLTTGEPQWVAAAFAAGHDDLAIRLARDMAASSTHPLSRAIVAKLRERTVDQDDGCAILDDVETLAGCGMKALVHGERVLLGSPALLQRQGVGLDETWWQDAVASFAGLTIVALARGKKPLAAFGFSETLRPSAGDLVAGLKLRGLAVGLLSGDRTGPVEALGKKLGIAAFAQLMPDEKVATLRQLQARSQSVAFVGDGINDAPSLAAADVGIAMGCGADIARAAADICLVGNDLNALPWLIDLAKAATAVVHQNLAFSFGYNAVGFALAASGWVHPVFAGFAMVASSIGVVANSMRLLPHGADKSVVSQVLKNDHHASDVSMPLVQGAQPCWSG